MSDTGMKGHKAVYVCVCVCVCVCKMCVIAYIQVFMANAMNIHTYSYFILTVNIQEDFLYW